MGWAATRWVAVPKQSNGAGFIDPLTSTGMSRACFALTMSALPTPCPRPCLGVEIVCTLPPAAFWPDARWSRESDTYEAYPRPLRRVAGRSLTEIRREIRLALRES